MAYNEQKNIVDYSEYIDNKSIKSRDYDSQGNFKSFSVLIMMDPCLLKEEKYKQMVLDYYNLELPTCQTPMWPKLNDKAGINHYTCHQCR